MGQPHGFQPLKMIENVEQKSGPFKNFPLYTVAECQRRNSCRKFMVLHCWHYPGLAGSTDCHVNVTFQPFLASFVALCFCLLHLPCLLTWPRSCMPLNCIVCCIAYTRFAVLVWCPDVYRFMVWTEVNHHLPALQLVWASCLPKITLWSH